MNEMDPLYHLEKELKQAIANADKLKAQQLKDAIVRVFYYRMRAELVEKYGIEVIILDNTLFSKIEDLTDFLS